MHENFIDTVFGFCFLYLAFWVVFLFLCQRQNASVTVKNNTISSPDHGLSWQLYLFKNMQIYVEREIWLLGSLCSEPNRFYGRNSKKNSVSFHDQWLQFNHCQQLSQPTNNLTKYIIFLNRQTIGTTTLHFIQIHLYYLDIYIYSCIILRCSLI